MGRKASAAPGGKPPKKGCIDSFIGPVTCIFFAVNFIFFILGIAALALGGVALFDEDSLNALTKMDNTGALTDINVAGFVKYLAIAFMGIGGALLLVGFLGCFGVAVGISCFIYLYCIIFSLLVVAQLAAFGYVQLNKDQLIVQLKDTLDKGVKTYQGNDGTSESDLEKAMNLVQKYMMCCGVNGGEDYRRSPWYNSTQRTAGQLVPVTCCKMKDSAKNVPSDSNCQTAPIGPTNPYTGQGCLDALRSYIFTRGTIAIIVSIIIQALQLVAVCYAACIEKSFSDDDLAAKLQKK